MNSKRERRARRKQKQRTAGERLNAHPVGAPSERAVATSFSDFAEFVRTTSDLSQVADSAKTELNAAADDVVRSACDLDLIKVVSSVRVGMILDRAVRGEEGSAAALELITLVLVCRDHELGVGGAVPSDQSGYLPARVQAAADRAMDAGRLISLCATTPRDADSQIVFLSVQREITLRNPIYPHMLLDTLRGLFADATVADDCRETLGFTGLQAVDIMEAARTVTMTKLEERFERMAAARDASLPIVRSMPKNRSARRPPTDDQVAIMQDVFTAMEDLTTNIATATIIDVDELAECTGLAPAIVEAVLDTFTLTGPDNRDQNLDRFFRGDNPLRTAPLVTNTCGQRMLVHDGLALPAIREVIEDRLQSADHWQPYKKHRGDWVENAAIDHLVGVFPTATVFRGFNYFVPDPKATTPQTEPTTFTKRVEGDGLIIIDDMALIIEVKAVALSAAARGGVASRLRGKLRDIVKAAADQADRLRHRIITDQRIRLDDEKWIDASGIREIHTIAVGLEDLSGITTATATLLAAGIINHDNIPWTVSIHDLRIVCELVDRPGELLLYLRRRTHALATWKYRAVDELDLFMHFLTCGLYIEPDPRRTTEALPWVGPPSAADLHRFEAQRPEVVLDETEALDAWYMAQLASPAHEPAPKPQLDADPKLLALIDRVGATGAPGWLATTAALLEGNGEVQRAFGRYATKLAARARKSGVHRSITHSMGASDGHVLLVWACLAPDDDLPLLAPHLSEYLRAKKHQTGAHRASCMIFDSRAVLVRLLYDNSPVVPDAELDCLAERLVPLEEMNDATHAPM
ncbi:hypothetical protein [Nocardia sp. NPDC059195]|uniref:hypothetical protein n=1 Tax=Nocardia sp. NPDC059195 TaxID=3346765 RepID=UPI0036B373F6